MSHGDEPKIAPGFEVFAISKNAPHAVVADTKNFWCHFIRSSSYPKRHFTFENFLKIACFNGDWTMQAYKK